MPYDKSTQNFEAIKFINLKVKASTDLSRDQKLFGANIKDSSFDSDLNYSILSLLLLSHYMHGHWNYVTMEGQIMRQR